jgi:hypothetical protein
MKYMGLLFLAGKAGCYYMEYILACDSLELVKHNKTVQYCLKST